MKNTTFTQQSIDFLLKTYDSTNFSTGALRYFPKAFQENPNRSIIEHIKQRFDELPQKTTCQGLLNVIGGASTRMQLGFPEQSEALAEAKVLLTPKVKDKQGANVRDLLLPLDEVGDVIDSLSRPTQRVVAWLAVSTGASPQDLLRDEFKLERLREGLIQVSPKKGNGQTLGRLIEFDPQPLLKMDPEGEITLLLNGAVFDGDGVGVVSSKYFNGLLNECAYNFYTLRASFAVHQRQAGFTWKEIALKMGVSDSIGLQERILRQAKANGIVLT